MTADQPTQSHGKGFLRTAGGYLGQLAHGEISIPALIVGGYNIAENAVPILNWTQGNQIGGITYLLARAARTIVPNGEPGSVGYTVLHGITGAAEAATAAATMIQSFTNGTTPVWDIPLYVLAAACTVDTLKTGKEIVGGIQMARQAYQGRVRGGVQDDSDGADSYTGASVYRQPRSGILSAIKRRLGRGTDVSEY